MLIRTAGSLLATAKRAADRQPQTVDEPLVAALFAAMAIEAWTNELLDEVAKSRPQDLIPPVDRLQPVIKAARLEERFTNLDVRLAVVGSVLTGQVLNQGEQPWQDCTLLFDVRNFLAHQRPERPSTEYTEETPGVFRTEQTKLSSLAERLVLRKLVARPSQGIVTSTLGLIHESTVGPWSVRVAAEVIRTVASWLPTEHRDSLLFGVEHLFPSS